MFEHYWRTIEGWPGDLPDLYTKMVNHFDDGAHFVEVGAYQGSSTSAMCVEIANSGKKIKFDVVDSWKWPNFEHLNGDMAYQKFIKNMEPLHEYHNVVKMDSIEAAKLYPDASLDFVCIDANHSYNHIKSDILAWLPKIKTNGILAGDDYCQLWSGVIKAVDEILPERILFQNRAWMWYNK